MKRYSPVRRSLLLLSLLSFSTSVIVHGEVAELKLLDTQNVLSLANEATLPGSSSAAFSAVEETATVAGFELISSVGRTFSSIAPDYLFGDEIFPPEFDLNDSPVDPLEYWRLEPMRPGEAVRVDVYVLKPGEEIQVEKHLATCPLTTYSAC